MDNQDEMEDDDALSSISFDARLAFTVDICESEELRMFQILNIS